MKTTPTAKNGITKYRAGARKVNWNLRKRVLSTCQRHRGRAPVLYPPCWRLWLWKRRNSYWSAAGWIFGVEKRKQSPLIPKKAKILLCRSAIWRRASFFIYGIAKRAGAHIGKKRGFDSPAKRIWLPHRGRKRVDLAVILVQRTADWNPSGKCAAHLATGSQQAQTKNIRENESLLVVESLSALYSRI